MADNVAITAGTGTTIAADEVTDGTLGSVKVQYVKLMDGTLDGTTKATVNATGLKVDASGAAVPVTDNAGSLTVDAPVGTPLFARLSDGTAALVGQKAMAASIPVVIASDQTINPHNVGTVVFKGAQYTSSQLGVALWTPASGKKIAVTALQIQAGGTTAGTMQLWFSAAGAPPQTYTRGTHYAIFDGEFAPSATLKPGVVMTPAVPYISSTADHVLRVTTSAAINPLTVTVWGYEV